MRRALTGLVVAAAIVALAAWAAAPFVELRIAEEFTRTAAAAGVTIADVQFAWREPLHLRGIFVVRADTGRVQVREADVRWTYAGGRDPRAHVRGFDLRDVRVQRGPLTIEMNEASFDVVSWEVKDGIEHLKLRQRPGGGEFEAQWRSAAPRAGGAVSLRALDLKATRVAWAGEEVVQPGTWTGAIDVAAIAPRRTVKAAVSAAGVQIALPSSVGGAVGEFGAPVAVRLGWESVREGDVLHLRTLLAQVGSLQLKGQAMIEHLDTDATIDATASARLELGSTFRAAGMALPVSVQTSGGLGTADVDLEVRGPLARPAELRLVPHLQFESTPRAVEKLQFLARPFRYEPAGSGVSIVVRAGAPDFIPISSVPPLFMRALLISEDAGFYGHPGVDVAEIPAAWADNVERGGFARGASTITQQLVKNLFLSGEKTLSRKLEEAALALMVDAAIPKARILEIYVNVIEWGPGLYGLVPAARHYFGKTPAQLTPKEIAFLVCLIPSPVRYHQAHLAGRAGPGMEQLMANLLAKLRSVDAIGEDDYAAALGEELRFAPETAAPASVS